MPLDFAVALTEEAAATARTALSLDQPLVTSLRNIGFGRGALHAIEWHNDAILCLSCFGEVLAEVERLTSVDHLSDYALAWLKEFRSLVKEAENAESNIYVFCD